MNSTQSNNIALSLTNFSKTFPGVRAVSSINLSVKQGMIHAIVGHNGSGKSTLIKCLAGMFSPDPGSSVHIFGNTLKPGDPLDAHRKGLRFVHQDLGIIPQLGPLDNLGLVAGYQRKFGKLINWKKQNDQANILLNRLGININPNILMSEVPPTDQTALAIARAISDWELTKQVLILDEPTAALPRDRVSELFSLIRELKKKSVTTIIVSHRLDEIIELVDSVTVLRDGRLVWDGSIGETSVNHLVQLIVNNEKDDQKNNITNTKLTRSTSEDPVLDVQDIETPLLHGFALKLNSGEVTGIAGLTGSGREEIPYILAGDQPDAIRGTYKLDGSIVNKISVNNLMALGVSFVPPDRILEGVINDFSVGENLSILALSQLKKRHLLSKSQEKFFTNQWLETVGVSPNLVSQPILTLSGGNQQKILMGRALSVAPRLLILAEPTSGIDIGARSIIYNQIREGAALGTAVLISSSDIEDLIQCCDRVIGVRDGEIVGEWIGLEIDKQSIAYAIEGGSND